jgi:hypothetical protein
MNQRAEMVQIQLDWRDPVRKRLDRSSKLREKTNLATGAEAAVEVVLVHPVLEVADPDSPVLVAPIAAKSTRRRRWGDRGRRREVLHELQRRRRWRSHHRVRRRVGNNHPPRLRHVVVRRVRVAVRVGVGVVLRHSNRRGIVGGRRRRHLHRRRSQEGGGRETRQDAGRAELARGGGGKEELVVGGEAAAI